MAVRRGGVTFVNAVELTRTFNGLLVFEPREQVKIVVRGHTATLRAGSDTANIDGRPVQLRAPTFMLNGDLYIPLDTIVRPDTGISVREIDARHLDLHVVVFASTKTPRQSPASALAVVPTAAVGPDGLHVSVRLRNTLDAPFTLTFPTSARVTFLVDRDGATVWNSGEGKRYLQSISEVTIEPKQAVTFSDVWPGWISAPPGRYQLRARVMVKPPLQSSPVSLGVVK